VITALLAGACGNDWGHQPDTVTPGSSPPGQAGATGDPDDADDAAGGGSDENLPVDAPGVTDSEIRVGGVASVTNPLGGTYGDAFNGVHAYFDMVNRDGGIYGRRLVLASERDDNLANNRSEVQGLISQDDVFAVLPVASLLFTGADLLVRDRVPTFGWAINPEWEGSADDPRDNLFGQNGSFLCFTCGTPVLPWLAGEIGARRIGLLAYAVPQSSDCATGVRAAFDTYGDVVGSEVTFVDQSLAFAVADLSVQVSKMKEAGVDLVTACMDTNGVVTLAREMRKQRLEAVQYLPNAYNHDFLEEFGDLFEGSYVRTDFVQWEVEDKPPGLERYLEWMEARGAEPSENSLVGWINADLFVTGLREAGPDFDRQKLIDAINRLTDYSADGMLEGVDWTRAHTEPPIPPCQFISLIEDSRFVPVFSEPGAPFVCVHDEGGLVIARTSG
jgi:ABC-type branched-subunit amino acid transport system substrate-binding protein